MKSGVDFPGLFIFPLIIFCYPPGIACIGIYSDSIVLSLPRYAINERSIFYRGIIGGILLSVSCSYTQTVLYTIVQRQVGVAILTTTIFDQWKVVAIFSFYIYLCTQFGFQCNILQAGRP